MPVHLPLPDPVTEMEASRSTGSRVEPAREQRLSRVQLVLASIAGVLIVLFAVLNLDKVEVNWIIGKHATPLIVVIIVSVLLGVLLDRGAVVLRRRRKGKG